METYIPKEVTKKKQQFLSSSFKWNIYVSRI